MSTAVFVPIYNASGAIEKVVKDLVARTWPADLRFYFLDNCSTDQSIDALKISIEKYGLKNSVVLKNRFNVGLGGSQKIAFEYAKNQNYDFLAIFHGDFQPTAKDLELALKEIVLSNSDALLGTRFQKGSKRINYDRTRLLGNYLLNFLYSLRFGRPVTDLGSGLNIYRTTINLDYAKLPNDLSFNCNLLALLLKSKRKIVWYPITWREGLAPSSLKALNLGFASLRPIFNLKNSYNYNSNFPETVSRFE